MTCAGGSREESSTKTRVVRSVFLTAFCVCLLATCTLAQVYDTHGQIGDYTFKLRLNIPASVPVVRGILIHCNGAGGDVTDSATDPEFVAFAEHIGFAVLATGLWYNFDYDEELELFEEMLQELADVSGHPELLHAPWLPFGFSNGGQMSYGLNAKRPWKVLGFITSKGALYNTYWPHTEALKTPGMLIAGQNDTEFRRNSVKALFDNNRPRGALWAWVEEEGRGHEEGNGQELKLTFLAECVRLRYPVDQSPLDGPIQLKDLHEFDGWLVDQSTWEMGLTTIYPYDEAPGDKRAYGWVPNEKIARYYQAFSSYDKASSAVTGSRGVTSSPATLTYSASLKTAPPTDPISMIEFFQNGVKIAEVAPPEDGPASISVEQHSGGFQVFSAVVTHASGLQKATHLRRVFVTGDRPPTAYEQWALMNLPGGPTGPWYTLFEDGVSNLKRFAFGLSLTEPYPDFRALQRAVPFIENIQGTDHVVYTYEVNELAVRSGLNIMPQVSSDQINWANVTNVDDPNSDHHSIVYRVGNVVTVKYPHSIDSPYFSLKVSDTYEGQELEDASLIEGRELEDASLIAHWALDEVEGDVARDLEGNGNHGVVIGDALWHPTGGRVDGALQLDGLDDYIDTGLSLNPKLGPFSVYLWAQGGEQGQVILSQASNRNWLSLEAGTGVLTTELADSLIPWSPLLSETRIDDGNWHHVGLVWDGAQRSLYMDGVEVAVDEAFVPIPFGADEPIYIGAGANLEPGTFFTGLIDDVCIYKRVVRP